MASSVRSHHSMARREEERVTPLELFFDLVFVLALTQCTSLMAAEPTATGIGKALLVLAVLWWGWVGYSWLTSVVDPEETSVRLAMFAAMAAFLVAALCVPEVFGDAGLAFAVAYAIVRAGHVALFLLASREDPGLRHSVLGFSISTSVGCGLLVAASFTDGAAQATLWALALLVDAGGVLIVDPSGWRLEPGHFAERHGLILIIALGESIVALGVGSQDVTGGVITASVLGIVLAAGLWWLYFDVVAYVATRVLTTTDEGRARNTLARDAFSHLHFPLVAGIALVALGLHEALAHVDQPLRTEPAAALFGGAAIYLLGHVLFNRRAVGTIKSHRLATAVVLVALIPVGTAVDAVVAVALCAAVVAGLVLYENLHYAEHRREIRAETAVHGHNGR